MSKKSENYSGIYKDMVEVLGEEITLKIYENYRGQQVTFPMRLYSKSYILEYLNKNELDKIFSIRENINTGFLHKETIYKVKGE